MTKYISVLCEKCHQPIPFAEIPKNAPAPEIEGPGGIVVTCLTCQHRARYGIEAFQILQLP